MTFESYIAIAFVLFTAWFVKQSIADYKLAKLSLAYATVKGRITHLDLWGKSPSRKTRLHLEYTYHYQNKAYTGSRIAFYTLHWPRTEEFAAAHPLNSYVDVFVNPNNPSQSILVKGVHPDKPYSEIAMSGFSLFTSLLILTGILYFGS